MPQVGAVGLKHAYAVVVVLDDIDIAFVVHRNPVRPAQLPLSTTRLTHRADEFPLCVENLHPCIVPFAHIDFTIGRHMDAGQLVEFPVAAAVIAELADKIALLIENLHAVVVTIGYIQIPVGPECGIVGMMEFPRLDVAFHFLGQIPTILRHTLGLSSGEQEEAQAEGQNGRQAGW